jgi:hypothetical protein
VKLSHPFRRFCYLQISFSYVIVVAYFTLHVPLRIGLLNDSRVHVSVSNASSCFLSLSGRVLQMQDATCPLPCSVDVKADRAVSFVIYC